MKIFAYYGNYHNNRETKFRFTTILETKQRTQIYIDVSHLDQIEILAFRVIQCELTFTHLPISAVLIEKFKKKKSNQTQKGMAFDKNNMII